MAAEFALILHAHLPYIRPAGKEILEERWLYEAVAETYLPLLWAFERLQADGVPARVAISLSGPLLSMLGDPGLMARCRGHLARVADLARLEADRLCLTPLAPAADYHWQHFARLVEEMDRRENDLLAGYKALENAGLVELFTAAGTHAYLPLLGSDAARAAHIEAGAGEFARHFGRRPAGLWLPECAYAPGLEHLLAAAGVRWFVAESTNVAAAFPPVAGPVVQTPGGVTAFARDVEASRRVWDSKIGYPGDAVYREFYRDAGFDLPLDVVRPWLVDGVRSDTGLKYYRVTGGEGEKEPWDPVAAFERAAQHASHFASVLATHNGLVVAPFDAELFGHWWFEGPVFIEMLFREIAAGDAVRAITPSDWLSEHGEAPLARIPAGSWGDGGDYRVWLSRANDWLWPDVHAAERKMAELVEHGLMPPNTLNQAARELLLAEASDWPFILYFQTAAEYARERVRRHLDRFSALASGAGDPCTFRPEDGVFPALQARTIFRRRPPVPTDGPLRVLMLSWEFPPNHVGGLGRHVHDLGAALVAAGHYVTVITVADPGRMPSTEEAAGVHVRWVARPPEEGNFLAWVYRLNRAMVAAAEELAGGRHTFDVIHSHDWLVGQAGMALKARWGTPLIATIHATERGRNNGIREPLQQAIHEEEWLLTSTADQVITVSRAMAKEVEESFRVAPTVIYNGVTMPNRAPGGPPLELDAPYFFYVGRLVQEKGIHVALQALAIMQNIAHFVVAGRGPMEAELKHLATAWGLENRVHFVDRVTDAERDAWLQNAAGGLVPSLYEPFGIVALEVMAAGVPAIVGDTGGLAEIVTHGVDGFKVTPGDRAELAAYMDRLLANPAEAQRIAAAGRATAAGRFGWPAIAAATAAVYRGAAEAGAEPGFRDVAAAKLPSE
ncbi:MAG TPA: 1,4-alpha-glucan branching protein domain-containing protein [Symbiobacteriaceae bacterium]|nr:1,4-alpha-glucan branching protein domain-containing protein [Symbiobacteriaceae bacterium]